MPRRPRVFVEGLIYHVDNRAGRGEAPFKLEDEAGRFWRLLHEVKKRDGLAVLVWCIMPNHYHLAVRTGGVPLWRSIRFLQHAFTQGFNRRCKVLRPLWQARYKARPVKDTDSLLRLLAYVHLNPVTANIVDDPARYRWSGHRELLRRTARPLIDADLVSTFFGGTRRQALHSYLSLLRRERGERWVGGRLEQLPWWRAEPEVEESGHGLDALGASAGPMRPSTSFRYQVSPSHHLKFATNAAFWGEALSGATAGSCDAKQYQVRIQRIRGRRLLAGVAPGQMEPGLAGRSARSTASAYLETSRRWPIFTRRTTNSTSRTS